MSLSQSSTGAGGMSVSTRIGGPVGDGVTTWGISSTPSDEHLQPTSETRTSVPSQKSSPLLFRDLSRTAPPIVLLPPIGGSSPNHPALKSSAPKIGPLERNTTPGRRGPPPGQARWSGPRSAAAHVPAAVRDSATGNIPAATQSSAVGPISAPEKNTAAEEISATEEIATGGSIPAAGPVEYPPQRPEVPTVASASSPILHPSSAFKGKGKAWMEPMMGPHADPPTSQFTQDELWKVAEGLVRIKHQHDRKAVVERVMAGNEETRKAHLKEAEEQ
ncbi:hypothetical protein OF83DRAFT_1180494 [Amylostereum chailletii]|nr:hypothetical protein OF83DRAFT_1180494 [Amylostereum chailletii]